MNTIYKKALFSLLAITLFSLSLSAQQNHFVYVQTENKQPFYVKLDKKILSSSVSGYLIIPKLQDGSYVFTIGFPKNEWPEQNVTCSINKKDAGYLLKNFGEKGWGLFNLQTLEVIMPGTRPADSKAAASDTKQDIFSNTLSTVVNDPSIVIKNEDKPTIKEEAKTVADVAKKDSVPDKITNTENEAVVTKKAEDKPVVKEEVKPASEAVKKEEPLKTPVQITKLLSSKSAEGTEMIYIDVVNGKADTISLFVPADKKEVIPAQEKKAEQPVVEIPKKEVAKKEEVKIDDAIKKEEPQKEIAKKEEVKNDVEIKKEEPKKEVAKKEEVKIDNAIKKEEPQKEIAKKEEVKNDVEIKKEEPKKELVKKEETKSNDPKFIDIELPNPNARKDTAAKQTIPVVPGNQKKEEVVQVPETPKETLKETPKETAAKSQIANSDCKSFATEDDFLKLRKKMAAENKDDDMITLAKKAFKAKCFTTEQVKNLGVLFLKDEGKYKFFDAAYPFVSDSYNFRSLEAQLSDNYFIIRFKAMIKH